MSCNQSTLTAISSSSVDSSCLKEEFSHSMFSENNFVEFYTQALQRNVIEVSSTEINLFRLLTSKKRKRKSYYIPVNFLPRVLKNDIRREYAKMLINSFNSGDDKLIYSFFRQFGHPNCQLIRHSANPISNDNPVVKYADGLDCLIPQLIKCIKLYPDIATTLQKCAVIPSFEKEEGSKIYFQATVKLTKIFKTTCPLEHQHSLAAHQNLLHYYGQPTLLNEDDDPSQAPKVWIVPNSNVTTLNTDNRQEVVDDVTNNINHQKLIMEPCIICQSIEKSQLQQPKEIIFTCHVAMCLDPQHRMYRLEIFSLQPSASPASSSV